MMAHVLSVVFLIISASCVYADDSVCGANESSNICGRICEPSCENPEPNPRTCPKIQCTDSTTRACRCNKGFLRDTTKKCVRAKNCSKRSKRSAVQTSPLCGDNEQFGSCGRICEGSCTNPNLSRCPATSCAYNGCQCKIGYLRNESTGSCVPAELCPETRSPRKSRQAEKCKEGEILAACGRICEGTCESPRTPEKCQRIRCADQGCRCDLASKFVRDKSTDKCVRIGKCPKKQRDTI